MLRTCSRILRPSIHIWKADRRHNLRSARWITSSPVRQRRKPSHPAGVYREKPEEDYVENDEDYLELESAEEKEKREEDGRQDLTSEGPSVASHIVQQGKDGVAEPVLAEAEDVAVEPAARMIPKSLPEESKESGDGRASNHESAHKFIASPETVSSGETSPSARDAQLGDNEENNHDKDMSHSPEGNPLGKTLHGSRQVGRMNKTNSTTMHAQDGMDSKESLADDRGLPPSKNNHVEASNNKTSQSGVAPGKPPTKETPPTGGLTPLDASLQELLHPDVQRDVQERGVFRSQDGGDLAIELQQAVLSGQDALIIGSEPQRLTLAGTYMLLAMNKAAEQRYWFPANPLHARQFSAVQGITTLIIQRYRTYPNGPLYDAAKAMLGKGVHSIVMSDANVASLSKEKNSDRFAAYTNRKKIAILTPAYFKRCLSNPLLCAKFQNVGLIIIEASGMGSGLDDLLRDIKTLPVRITAKQQRLLFAPSVITRLMALANEFLAEGYSLLNAKAVPKKHSAKTQSPKDGKQSDDAHEPFPASGSARKPKSTQAKQAKSTSKRGVHAPQERKHSNVQAQRGPLGVSTEI